MACIYCVTNSVNGKKYVGQTNMTADRRWKGHCQAAKRNGDHLIHRAIRKYGNTFFNVETLEECMSDELNEREMFWIASFNSNALSGGHGYNMTDGGGGAKGFKHSSEMKQKRSKRFTGSGNPFYGKTHTQEVRELISKTNKGRPCHPNTKAGAFKKWKGVPKSEETRKRMSASRTPLKKPVIQLDLEENQLRVHDSIKDAVRWLQANGVPAAKKVYIRNCCTGRRESGVAWGFRWKFFVEDVQLQISTD